MDNSIEDFKKECDDNKKKFLNEAPFTADKSSDNTKAFDKLHEFRTHTTELRQQEEQMKFGLEIFEIDPINYTQLSFVER